MCWAQSSLLQAAGVVWRTRSALPWDAYAPLPELEGDGHLGLEHGDHIIIPFKPNFFGSVDVGVGFWLLS